MPRSDCTRPRRGSAASRHWPGIPAPGRRSGAASRARNGAPGKDRAASGGYSVIEDPEFFATQSSERELFTENQPLQQGCSELLTLIHNAKKSCCVELVCPLKTAPCRKAFNHNTPPLNT